MKPLLSIILFGLFIACSKDEKLKDVSIPKILILKEMSGSFAADASPKENSLEWQETYTLTNDGDFTKLRISLDGKKEESSGTYRLVQNASETYLEFSHTTESAIIGSCTKGIESLMYKNDRRWHSTWSACDGPNMIYEPAD